MFIFRLLLLFMLWLLIRRLWRSYTQGRTSTRRSTTREPYPGPADQKDRKLDDITQQEISEADFEELDESGR
jgi:hypothetical protein